ncbi:MAG: sigma-70 family RNA polymerase sigma factor [Phycisphaeraceae bacterium]|nr:MAG: sigma-70 family RNA polymerase sigma factor [Phycisphaeraceae bacterium]
MLIDPKDLQFANMVIARRIQALRSSGSLPNGEVEDFAAELMLHLLSVWDDFDHTRGTREAYINTVVTTRSVSLLRKRKAKKRGSAQPAADVDPGECADHQTDGEAAERLSDLKADLEVVMERLSPMQRRLVNRLMRDAVKPVADALGMPRSTLRGHCRRMRDIFKDAGLEGYL